MSKEKNKENKKLYISLGVWVLYIIWLLKLSSSALSITNFLVHLLFVVILLAIYKNDLTKAFKKLQKNKSKSIKTIIFGLIMLFILLFASNIVISVITNMMGNSFDTDSSSSALFKLFDTFPFGTLFAMFMTIFFYPIVEELVFRKSLYDVIKSPILFIILSSVITWYFQVTLTSPHISEFILSLTVLFNSVFMSILLVKKDNILFPIFSRMSYNLVICLINLIPLFIK